MSSLLNEVVDCFHLVELARGLSELGCAGVKLVEWRGGVVLPEQGLVMPRCGDLWGGNVGLTRSLLSQMLEGGRE